MSDLVDWMRVQLDDDKEAAVVAAALTRSPWTSTASTITCADGFTVAGVEDGERATAVHIARWDPARVMALMQALRTILDSFSWEAQETRAIQVLGEALYADRPGYREEWRL